MPDAAVLQNKKDTIKIVVLGAAGGIGQSLSLLIKSQLYYMVKTEKRLHLALYDINKDAIAGVVADMSHIDTPITISAHYSDSQDPNESLKACLTDASIVLIPAGVPRKPGMTRDDLFKINAGIVTQLTDSIIEYCDLKKLFILLISNPINSLIPVILNRFKNSNVVDSNIEKRLFGITTLDSTRGAIFLKDMLNDLKISSGLQLMEMPHVPVIGGHSGDTIIPVFSQCSAADNLSQDQISHLIHRIQYGGDEIVMAKKGKGSATLSMAHSSFKMLIKFIDLLLGNSNDITITSYISLTTLDDNEIATGGKELMSRINNLKYFAIPTVVSIDGIKEIKFKIIDYLNYNEFNELLPICLENLNSNIITGESFPK
ncbi:similar to Saccharomyces cerevisiae YOL126C MDH2 Cytoplasmic malate dehydrogenase, one of three isozymes that catalyze interconversion of malate and oxaloacetate [Maudiozyma barnettii]|uniref:malate dehydrogenase n=1 Tax=Maudiozyma barnettii TaxID=61262 RepID=A0A8H2VJF6_9SACH|nr:malate dehydrogenase MDH2 [Kazachstania barnettii]CAB4256804.1 similar to Saccharomyces cerevisiae YOL126C MDH2 Cytoplasmic malate dehydrogenase, one of three isozymes that catalyze interconversion of malate and oxaloacetate [Kazachstania barnettii]CAD1785457.1 similar to Saccharomyces cerevisiae YOL126C MDH2 Cytoplasmic malate dehydrogenase, one of three isozymes that catalyze interconversion of malate and oxaloacetate [Kazachstania barnettii]